MDSRAIDAKFDNNDPTPLPNSKMHDQTLSLPGVGSKTVLHKGRGRMGSRLRAAAAHVGREVGGISLTEAAKYLGRDLSTLSLALKRIEAELRTDRQQRQRLERLKLREIAQQFGTGSYGAVGWACNGVTAKMKSDAKFRDQVGRIRQSCQQKT